LKIRLRRGTAAQWASANPVLSSGEAGFVTDTNTLKIGNGAAAFAALDAIGGGGGVSDGDKGDITVTGSGATWTIENGAVTAAKFQDIAQDRLIGRVTTGTGSVETLTAADVRTLLNVEDGANANGTASTPLVIENRTSDPSAPSTGQIWLRTDL
jgi:hypothetical protein